MNNLNRMMIVAASMAAFAVNGVRAQDWPQWLGADRTAKAAGFSAPKTWPKELNQKWKVTVGQGDASPALVGDKIYIFTRVDADEVTSCLDAATGKELWHDKYAAQTVSGPAAQHPGPRSSPTVADGKVITFGVGGALSCLDAATGKVLWRKNDFPGEWPRFFTAASPIVVDGLCVAQCGKQGSGAVVAYDLASGDQKWKWAAEGPGYASPVLLTVGGTKMVVAETEKNLVGLGAKDGKLLWQSAFMAQGMAANSATPIIDGATIYFAGQARGTRAVKIEKQGDTFTATELWSNPENAIQFNTPILKNGLLFGLSQRGNFFCVDAQSGKTLWAESAGGRGGFGSIVDAGPVLVALTSKSQLEVFQPSGKEFTAVASLKAADKPTYAYPVLAGNRIFVKDLDSLTLWTLD